MDTQTLDKPFLAIDSSLKGVSVGLFGPKQEDGTFPLWQHRVCHDTYGSSQYLPIGTSECLEAENLTLSDLGGIFVSHGPGSFTGIKIGIAFCQGLLKGLDSAKKEKPKAVGFSSLMALRAIKSEYDAIALGATKTAGYLLASFDGTLLHGVLSSSKEGAYACHVDGQRVFPFEKKGLKVCFPLAFESFERFVEQEGSEVVRREYSEVSLEILKGLVVLGAGALEAEGSVFGKLAPQYYRKSAAEERLGEKS